MDAFKRPGCEVIGECHAFLDQGATYASADEDDNFLRAGCSRVNARLDSCVMKLFDKSPVARGMTVGIAIDGKPRTKLWRRYTGLFREAIDLAKAHDEGLSGYFEAR